MNCWFVRKTNRNPYDRKKHSRHQNWLRKRKSNSLKRYLSKEREKKEKYKALINWHFTQIYPLIQLSLGSQMMINLSLLNTRMNKYACVEAWAHKYEHTLVIKNKWTKVHIQRHIRAYIEVQSCAHTPNVDAWMHTTIIYT